MYSKKPTKYYRNPRKNQGSNPIRDMDYIELCKKELRKSYMKHRHGAIVVGKDGKAIGGYNYMKKAKDSRSIHAEVSAIQNFMVRYPKEFLKDSSLIVIRENLSGNICNSSPCPACRKYISRHKIPVIMYSV